MCRVVIFALLAFWVLLTSAPARAELPSLLPDDPIVKEQKIRDTEKRDLVPPLVSGLQSWHQDKFNFQHGGVMYRLGGKGVRAMFDVAGVKANALIGYSGEYRLEFVQRAHGQNFKFAFTTKGGDSTYRLEYTYRF